MALSPSANHSVTKAQAPEGKVAARTEGNDKEGAHQSSAFPVSSLRAVTRGLCTVCHRTFLLGAKGHSLCIFSATTRPL